MPADSARPGARSRKPGAKGTAARTPLPVVLLTGFAPFDGAAGNPSWQAVSALHGRRIAGHRLVARELPTEFGTSLQALRKLLREFKPRLVICVGLAGNRAVLSLERVAINVDDARIPDNAGAQPIDCAVIDGAPAAYFSTLPIKRMHAALRTAGIASEVSQTAGTFVCNHVFYGLMHALRRQPKVRAGFIHVPPDDVMPVEHVSAGLLLAARMALGPEADTPLAAGAVS